MPTESSKWSRFHNSLSSRDLMLRAMTLAASMILVLLIDSGASGAEEDSILGSRLSSKALSVSTPFSFRTAGNFLVLKTGEGWTENAIVSILDLTTLKEQWSRRGTCHAYSISGGKTPSIVLHKIVDEGIVDADVRDLDGTRLFSKTNFVGSISSSPNGRFFYTEFCHTSVNRFAVFDRQGNELFHRKGALGEWYSVAVSDSVIAYFTPTKVEFLSVPSGSVVSTVNWPGRSTGDYPIARISKDGGWMIAYTYGKIGCFSPGLELAWELPVTKIFIDAAISGSDGLVAILENERKTGIHVLSVYNISTGSLFWSKEMVIDSKEIVSDCSGLSFEGDFITWVTQYYKFWGEGVVNSQTKTFVFDLKQRPSETQSFMAFPGVVSLAARGDQLVVVKAESGLSGLIEVERRSNVADK